MRLVAGRYELLELLGSGGVSEVHQARDRQTGAAVALKELLPQFVADRAVCRRFLREAEVARRLDHPGIVPVLDAGEEGGRPYLVMELVEGEDLRRRLDRAGALHWPEALRIILAVARALEHAHGRGVVHRDLKPHNVLLSGTQVKLTDFGLARVQTLASLTGSSLVWGSPEYMAPELFGRGRADPRSDLYSLGVMLFEVATGRLPWKDRSLARLASAVGDEAPVLPTAGQGEAIDRLLALLLAPAPADRPSDVAEVIAVLEGRALPPAPVGVVPCGGCGQPRPEDVPQCFACGHRDLVGGHVVGGRWSVLLKEMKDDVASMEALHQVLGSFTGRRDLRLKFLIGQRGLYSKKEQEEAIKLPAVLFSHLDGATARELEQSLRARGFRVTATRRKILDLWRHPPARAAVGASMIFTTVASVFAAATEGMFSALPMASVVATGGVIVYWAAKLSSRRGLFHLRPAPAPAPGADRLLAPARETSGTLKAPEVRSLFVEVSRELYRLTRRAEELARQQPAGSNEEALCRRLIDGAPAVSARLEAVARRLEALDAALERESDGETMRALASLERRLGHGSDAALESTRRDLEAALERRQRAEGERERLAASLCRTLATLRDSYRRTRTLTTVEEREAAAVTAALAELDGEIA